MNRSEPLYPTTPPPRKFPNEVSEASYIVQGYLNGFNPPFEGWHHIDNATGDLLREIIKQLVRHIYNEREPMKNATIVVSDSAHYDMFQKESNENYNR